MATVWLPPARLATALLIVVMVAAPASRAPAADARLRATEANQFARQSNEFAFRLFGNIAHAHVTDNLVVSPLSATLALTMTYNGATGATAREMASALQLANMSLDDVNKQSAALLTQLTREEAKVKLHIADSLWGDSRRIRFKPSFLQAAHLYFKAKVSTLDFDDPRSPGIINDWVRKETRGKIGGIVDTMDPADVAYLLNAIYFKGEWAQQFDKSATHTVDFYLSNGGRKVVFMMQQDFTAGYLATPSFQAIELPYADRHLTMLVFLPGQRLGLSGFERLLTATNWDSWMKQFSNRDVSLQIPRFTIRFGIQLNKVLKSLGVQLAFDPRRAGFHAMGTSPIGNIFIGGVRQKAFIDVYEAGTEAAAVTAVRMVATSYHPPDVTLVVNRPFFYAIRDTQSGAILFMGAVNEPASQRQ